MGDLRTVPLSSIKENPVALRNVNRKSEQFRGLCDSMQSKGFLGTITVVEEEDPETGEKHLTIVDGLHRFSAAQEVGIKEINVDVVDLSKQDILLVQIMANEHRVDTRPIEYSQQLRRVLAANETMTEAELASQLGKSPKWIQDRLGLNAIKNEKIQKLINEGKIKLANAYPLAKLPEEEQANFIDAAMIDKPDEFLPKINKRIKDIKEARRQGREATSNEFEAVPFLRKVGLIKDEHETGAVGKALIAKLGVATPAEAFALAIAWALNMDPDSVEEQRKKHEQRLADREEAKKARDIEKAQKRAKEYEEKADKARKEAAEAAAAAAANA